MPDMDWVGPNYWGNRLQDWSIKDGVVECDYHGPNRSLHNLNTQLGNSRNTFSSRVGLRFSETVISSGKNRIGFLLGAKNWNLEYRASAVRGKGLKVGINSLGNLFIGDEEFKDVCIDKLHLTKGIILEVAGEPIGSKYRLYLNVYNKQADKIAEVEKSNIEPEDLIGNIALLSDIDEYKAKERDKPAGVFDKWELHGKKLDYNPQQSFGPLCFTQYTRHRHKVKLTAQLCPVPLPAKVIFEVKQGERWKQLEEANVEYPSYTAQFRFDNWEHEVSVPFRVYYDFPYKDESKERFFWKGTIAEEPVSKESVKALVFSCNYDLAFPDQDIIENAPKHDPDLIMFLGDQFYEINGGFGFQTAPLEKAYLDYLRKWYMFGWSYRKLFQHLPTINLPDDHDVFQGNLFGAGGKPLPKGSVNNALKRDFGGFMMPPEWVNLAMTTQTSHMPDPYDPEAIEQGIHVFYTNWNYGGISFGIIEDRKFKSGPAEILPKEAKVRDAFPQNEKYEIKNKRFPHAELLGERQIDFLNEWVEDWTEDTKFKILVSAAPFHALQTLPGGEKNNGIQQRLPIPEPGEYVEGDVPVADMDSGGWPQNKRDEVLKLIRKSYTLHLAGDQHLASVTQYGVNDYRDAGYSFAVPALTNSWPRRWWPPVDTNHQPVEGQPAYTGNHEDAFGNKIHVRAVANPVKTGLEPRNLFDRSTGYGVVSFNKKSREIVLECWPRFINPETQPNGQYPGWPVTVKQLENFVPFNPHFLPVVLVKGLAEPIIKVYDSEQELQLVIRIKGKEFQPVVEKQGIYSILVLDSGGNKIKEVKDLEAVPSSNHKKISI